MAGSRTPGAAAPIPLTSPQAQTLRLVIQAGTDAAAMLLGQLPFDPSEFRTQTDDMLRERLAELPLHEAHRHAYARAFDACILASLTGGRA